MGYITLILFMVYVYDETKSTFLNKIRVENTIDIDNMNGILGTMWKCANIIIF